MFIHESLEFVIGVEFHLTHSETLFQVPDVFSDNNLRNPCYTDVFLLHYHGKGALGVTFYRRDDTKTD